MADEIQEIEASDFQVFNFSIIEDATKILSLREEEIFLAEKIYNDVEFVNTEKENTSLVDIGDSNFFNSFYVDKTNLTTAVNNINEILLDTNNILLDKVVLLSSEYKLQIDVCQEYEQPVTIPINKPGTTATKIYSFTAMNKLTKEIVVWDTTDPNSKSPDGNDYNYVDVLPYLN